MGAGSTEAIRSQRIQIQEDNEGYEVMENSEEKPSILGRCIAWLLVLVYMALNIVLVVGVYSAIILLFKLGYRVLFG
jgi:hypothetical protein